MKHTVIIGGTKGIGLAFTELLLNHSSNEDKITLISRHASDFNINHINKSIIKSFNIDILNISQDSDILINYFKENPIHSLVFFQKYRKSNENENIWNGEIQLTLTATQNLIELLKPLFSLDRVNKSIVLVSSVASYFIATEQPVGYHVAKAGLTQMARYYAVELGQKYNIRVNSVCPVTILKKESEQFYLNNSELYSLYESITPLKRMGTATEIAQVIQFLTSDQASFVTGQEITVDGGISLMWQESLARTLVDSTKNLNVTRK